MESDGFHIDGAYWDRVLEGWQPSVAHRLWRAHSDAVNVGLLRRWLPGGGERLLKTDLFDEAVGRGLYPELASRSAEVVAVDLSPAAVRAASGRYPSLEAVEASVLEIPFPSASFDAVVSNSTLDHFGSYELLGRSVAELARLLRRGGRLLITLDNRANPVVAARTSAALFRPLHSLGVVPYFVGVTVGPGGLVKLLRQAGFDVAHRAAVMHCPPQVAAHLAASRRGAASEYSELERRHLRMVLRFETMARWPTRNLTGHFIGALAIKL